MLQLWQRRPTNADRKTSTRTAEDAVEVEAADTLVEKMDRVVDPADAVDTETTRKATRRTCFALSGE